MDFREFFDELKSKSQTKKIPKGAIKAAVVIVAVLVVFALFRFGAFSGAVSGEESDAFVSHNSTDKADATASLDTAAQSSGVEQIGSATVFVHVVGAVKFPGVYELSPTARIIDAVNAAGGLKAKADAAAVNMADIVKDGQQIRIPKIGEAPQATSAAASGVGGGAVSGASGSQAALVNINTASAEELKTLSGIGDATAVKIINYRESVAAFKKIEDLMEVPGIGEGKFAQVKTSICV
jgi:competence protein ComEA